MERDDLLFLAFMILTLSVAIGRFGCLTWKGDVRRCSWTRR